MVLWYYYITCLSYSVKFYVWTCTAIQYRHFSIAASSPNSCCLIFLRYKYHSNNHSFNYNTLIYFPLTEGPGFTRRIIDSYNVSLDCLFNSLTMLWLRMLPRLLLNVPLYVFQRQRPTAVLTLDCQNLLSAPKLLYYLHIPKQN